MTRQILCAVDLTHAEEARKLIAEAGRIAGRDGATLSLVTVLPDYGMSFVGSFFEAGTLKDAIAAAQTALHDLAGAVLGQQVQCIIATGTAYEEILQAAQKIGADLIVVGAHKPDLADRVMGPNAARVARHAAQSVLVLRL